MATFCIINTRTGAVAATCSEKSPAITHADRLIHETGVFHQVVKGTKPLEKIIDSHLAGMARESSALARAEKQGSQRKAHECRKRLGVHMEAFVTLERAVAAIERLQRGAA